MQVSAHFASDRAEKGGARRAEVREGGFERRHYARDGGDRREVDGSMHSLYLQTGCDERPSQLASRPELNDGPKRLPSKRLDAALGGR